MKRRAMPAGLCVLTEHLQKRPRSRHGVNVQSRVHKVERQGAHVRDPVRAKPEREQLGKEDDGKRARRVQVQLPVPCAERDRHALDDLQVSEEREKRGKVLRRAGPDLSGAVVSAT
ncbi:hypothetical protein AMAG_17700 [Allomyces macrogynus ATCC 38327]|uniref:Uncharacterized protein n=1 Tax=Allomyces macrogynus (strain ATCC 38327) TaxID=578462 RepID=A0A0L0RX71_ALLM3|nr:hypothetical protein AMAG_17700 [Allomyces macrogynus ATCC 38327]|eukprot:KNE54740.1 hypothetical protein AMAG_17700 [Allomyces macrogynus ATCC 38327]